MTTEEQAQAILDIMKRNAEAIRLLNECVLTLDRRLSALEARVPEARGAATVLH